jgi:hypothetical protein
VVGQGPNLGTGRTRSDGCRPGSAARCRQQDIAWLAHALAWSQAAPITIVGAYLLYAYINSKKKADAEPARFSLAEYMQVPDYKVSLGNIHHIHEDMGRVLSVIPRAAGSATADPLVIFIDDLDRCPTKVANVVEGVSMFLATDTFRLHVRNCHRSPNDCRFT